MALANKKYEKFYETTGTGNDKINTTNQVIFVYLYIYIFIYIFIYILYIL